MNLLDVQQIVGSKLPPRLSSLLDFLGITISVHDPTEREIGASIPNGSVAYIYGTDGPSADPPWNQTGECLEDGQLVFSRGKKDGVIEALDNMCVGFMRAKQLAEKEAAAKKQGVNTHMLRVFLPGGRITVTVPNAIGLELIEQWHKVLRGDSHHKEIILTAEADSGDRVIVYGPDVSAMMLTELSADSAQEIGPRSDEAPKVK